MWSIITFQSAAEAVFMRSTCRRDSGVAPFVAPLNSLLSVKIYTPANANGAMLAQGARTGLNRER